MQGLRGQGLGTYIDRSYARSSLVPRPLRSRYTFSIYGSPSEAGVIVKLAVFRDLSGDNASSTWLSTRSVWLLTVLSVLMATEHYYPQGQGPASTNENPLDDATIEQGD